MTSYKTLYLQLLKQQEQIAKQQQNKLDCIKQQKTNVYLAHATNFKFVLETNEIMWNILQSDSDSPHTMTLRCPTTCEPDNVIEKLQHCNHQRLVIIYDATLYREIVKTNNGKKDIVIDPNRSSTDNESCVGIQCKFCGKEFDPKLITVLENFIYTESLSNVSDSTSFNSEEKEILGI